MTINLLQADGGDYLLAEVSEPGPPGLSAYGVAVANGFVGTEQDWLASLGGGGGGNYLQFNQSTPSSTWTINHNFGARTNVAVFSSGGIEVWAEVVHTSINQAVVLFDAPFAGFAILS